MSPHQLRLAATALKNGKIIAYPTEAVWGLGCDPLNPQAVYELLRLKNRPVSKGLILIASRFEQLQRYLQPLDPKSLQPAFDSWPGPHTWLIPANDSTPHWITGNFSSIAVRITAHPIARAICDAANMAIISTSCNSSGQAPARSLLEARLAVPQAGFFANGPVNLNASPSTIHDLLTEKIIRA